jgi:hypothetical protein
MILSSVLLLGACQDDAPAEVRDGGSGGSGSGDSARDAGLLPLPELECAPDLASMESGIFKRACAFVNCHTQNGFAGNLVLADTDIRKELVGVEAATCPGWKRVVPGAPEASFFWHKLTLDEPECGERMAWGYERLPEPILDCVRNWILGLSSEGDAATDSHEDRAPDGS